MHKNRRAGGFLLAALRLQHASCITQHAKIKSGFTTEATEFTERELLSAAVLVVLVLGAPLEGRTKPGIPPSAVPQFDLAKSETRQAGKPAGFSG